MRPGWLDASAHRHQQGPPAGGAGPFKCWGFQGRGAVGCGAHGRERGRPRNWGPGVKCCGSSMLWATQRHPLLGRTMAGCEGWNHCISHGSARWASTNRRLGVSCSHDRLVGLNDRYDTLCMFIYSILPVMMFPYVPIDCKRM